MASEIVQDKNAYPTVNPPNVNSKARGYENVAKVFGNIAERSFNQATSYESDASKANLLQSHGMLQDVEAQSKIEMLKSPGHAGVIAKNAENTITKLKNDAVLNRGDRLQLGQMADSTSRSLNLSAAEKTISLAREQAKFAALSSLGDTLQSIRQDIHTNPEKADALIEAQYAAIRGQVNAGIITAVEGANIHKQFYAELQMAHELVEGIKSGALSAADINTYHATEPGQIPMSNAGLPIDHVTAMNSEHYFGQMTSHDIESRMANGERVSPRELTGIKTIPHLDKLLNYGAGAARATGEINAGTSWVELNHKLDLLRKKEKLSSREEGYKNRLNNFIQNANQPGHYQNFIAGMPEGARAYQDYAQKQAVIDSGVGFGTAEQSSLEKHIRTTDNLNELISKSAAIGIGMQYPDHLRQPIPFQLLNPIVSSFEKGGDITGAINNIQILTPKNRVYAMNAFKDNPRKAMTVYEVGNLTGKVEQGFLVDLMASQQVDALGKKDNQEKFQQLEKGREGYSDAKLSAKIAPAISSVMNWLRVQPDGGNVASAKVDQGVRYINYMAQQHGDYNFKNIDEYIQTFKNNTEAAYGVSTGTNYVLDNNNVPLEPDQQQVYADYAINDARNKLLKYKTEEQVNNIFTSRPPMLVSSPGGRTEVVYPDGHLVVDEHGQPAFSQIFSESGWRLAEQTMNDNNPYKENGKKSDIHGHHTPFEFLNIPEHNKYYRGKSDLVKPAVEGNIDLENRPKVFDKSGNYSTVSTATFGIENGKTVLLPTIINGKRVSKKEAFEHFKKTKEHLGIFNSEKEADIYDEHLHKRMGWTGEANKWGKK